jgi:hypothetical protein
MRRVKLSIAIILGILTAPLGVQAAATTISGTITGFQAATTVGGTEGWGEAGVVIFHLSTTPAATGCAGGTSWFMISAVSVSDATTRNNIAATLLMAYSLGLSVSVAYDNAGNACDPAGFAVPISVQLGS